MSELLQSKKFMSAVIGVILIIIVNFIFSDKPDKIDNLQYIIAGLFGVHISAQGIADFNKEKAKEDRKKAEAEANKAEFDAQVAVVASKIPMPTDTSWREDK